MLSPSHARDVARLTVGRDGAPTGSMRPDMAASINIFRRSAAGVTARRTVATRARRISALPERILGWPVPRPAPTLRAMSQIGDTSPAKAVFHPRALAEIRALPRPVRKRIGSAIWDLQLGRRIGMPLARPMPSVASGAGELRLHDESAQYRVLYCIRPGLGVAVLSAFAKRTNRIPMRELRLARHRLRDLLNEEEG